MKAPTPKECDTHAGIAITVDGQSVTGYAIWYPQMGGYCAKAVIVPGEQCFEAFVWHDGSFPFEDEPGGERRNPARLHHCDADQFVQFGKNVRWIQAKANAS